MWVFKRKPNFSCDNFPDNLCSSPHSVNKYHVDFDGDSFKRDAVGTDPSPYAAYKDGRDFKLRSTWRSSFTNSVQLNKARSGPLRHLSELYDTLYMSEVESLTDVSSTITPSAATDSTLSSPLSFSDDVKLSLPESCPAPLAKSEPPTQRVSHVNQRHERSSFRKESIPSVYVFDNLDDDLLSEWSDDGDAVTDCEKEENQTSHPNQFFAAVHKSLSVNDGVRASQTKHLSMSAPSGNKTKQKNYTEMFRNVKQEDEVFTLPEAPVSVSRAKADNGYARRHLTQYTLPEECEYESEFDFTDNFKGQSTIMRARNLSFLPGTERVPTMESISLRNRVLPYIRIAKSNLPTLYQLGITESVSKPNDNANTSPNRIQGSPVVDYEDNYRKTSSCFSPAIDLQEQSGVAPQNNRVSTQLITPRCNYDLFDCTEGNSYSNEDMSTALADRRKSFRVSLCRSPRSPRHLKRPQTCSSPDSPNVGYTIPELQEMVL